MLESSRNRPRAAPGPDVGASKGKIEGFVDAFDGRRIIGWVYDATDPGRRLQIKISVDDDVITVLADQERPDVAAAGKNDGFCGFTAELHLNVKNSALIHVREAATNTELVGSPIDPTQILYTPLADSGSIEGHIDFVDGNRIVGWAHDRTLPGRRLQIEIVIGESCATVVADQFREDVAAAGVNDGHCGFVFSFDVDAAIDRPIHVREALTGQDLTGSPFYADIPRRLADSDHREAIKVLEAEVRLARHKLYGSSAPRALHAALTPGSKLDRLLETAFPDSDPEGLITRYVAFEIVRSGQRDFVPDGTLVERMRILKWYLTECGAYHGMTVPLSRQQLAFLNAPMPLFGVELEISVAAYAFILAEYNPVIDLRNPNELAQALRWWCLKRSQQIAPCGELITPALVRALVVPDSLEALPLSAFLRDLCTSDPILARLNLRSDAERAVLAVIVALRALSKVYLAKLLPRDLIIALLQERTLDQITLFDAVLRLSCGTDSRPVIDGVEELGRRARVVLRDTLSTPVCHPPGSGPPFQRDSQIADGLEPGIAVIGPMRATSGLGQAARLSLDILRRAGHMPAQLDFFPGNSAPISFTDRLGSMPLHVPRRVNLLHLNAEVVPHAFALLDRRITERSYNIGYFFWELDMVPECHRLAFDLLDEIWVSSEFNRETYARVTDLPVHNVGMAVEDVGDVPALGRLSLGVPEDAFVFLATLDAFSYVERKNPLGLVKAFQAAFSVKLDERVALVIKTQNRDRVVDPDQRAIWKKIEDIAARDRRIIMINRTLEYRELIALKRACDAYVSLHRSEGWGFGCLEAMQLGLPVIATGYSGVLEYCCPKTAFLVDYELVSVLPSEYIHVSRNSQWAEPSFSSATAALRAVYENPALRQSKADAGRHRAATEFSFETIVKRYKDRLNTIEKLY